MSAPMPILDDAGFGDIDALRLKLQGMLRSAASVVNSDAAQCSPEKCSPDMPPAAASTSTFESCGLTLRSQLVMGGARVWPAAVALAELLRERPSLCRGARVIELGAGAGAPGLVCADLGASFVLLTDGDADLLPLLAANAARNGFAAVTRCACFDWRDARQLARIAGGETEDATSDAADGTGSAGCLERGRAAASFAFAPLVGPAGLGEESSEGGAGAGDFDLVLAADVTFSFGDVRPLARAAASLLRRAEGSGDRRLLLARSGLFEELEPTLLAAMQEEGLELLSRREGSQANATVLELGWR